jgi:hypothetical protein
MYSGLSAFADDASRDSTVSDQDAESQCIKLLTRVYRHIDRREYNAIYPLFAPDGTWQRPEGVIRAGDDMRASMARRSTSLAINHVLTNLLADVTAPDHVTVRGYMTIYRDETGASRPPPYSLGVPTSLIDVTATCRKVGDDWRLAAIEANYLAKA